MSQFQASPRKERASPRSTTCTPFPFHHIAKSVVTNVIVLHSNGTICSIKHTLYRADLYNTGVTLSASLEIEVALFVSISTKFWFSFLHEYDALFYYKNGNKEKYLFTS